MSVEGGAFSVIATGITTQSYTITGLTVGTNYEFTVEAQNSVGFSSPSTSVAFLHAIAPDQPEKPTTSNVGTNVLIDWYEPYDQGADITSFSILIRHSDGVSFSEELTSCDGTDSVIV